MKFSINIEKYALLISLILIPSTAKPMHATAAQKLLSKFCTALGWSIAAGPSFYEGAKRVHRMRMAMQSRWFDKLEDESPEITQFVHEVLKERGVPNYQTIAIKKNPKKNYRTLPFEYAASPMNSILIPQGPDVAISDREYIIKSKDDPYLTLKELAESTAYYQNLDENLRQKAWLEKQRLSSYVNQQHVEHALNLCNESLNVHRTVIHHEAAHIVNKDGGKKTIACFTIPLITHACLKLGAYPLKQLLNNPYKVNILTKGMLKISAAALIKCPINYVMPYIYARYQEQRADNYIANDLALLKSRQDYLKVMTNLWIEVQEIQDNTKDWQNIVEQSHPIISEFAFFKIDQVHPSYWRRAAKHEKQIAKLAQQQAVTREQE